jgi:hypothetical protein
MHRRARAVRFRAVDFARQPFLDVLLVQMLALALIGTVK